MTKHYSTQKSLLLSAISLLVCVAMLIGTTFAWFTDSVTSGKNVITAGNLDVEMYCADGTQDPATVEWTDASNETIFDYDKWEPGYAEVKHIKIANNGTLALKYLVALSFEDTVSKLAEALDVYVSVGDKAVQAAKRDDLIDTSKFMKIGTLQSVLASNSLDLTGNLMPKGTEGKASENTLTIGIKMQEEAGNEYQKLSIGNGFTVIVKAFQYTYEYDSFDNQYDKDVKIESNWDGTIPNERPDTFVYDLDNKKVYVKDAKALAYLNKLDDKGAPVVKSEIEELIKEAKLSSWSYEGFEVVIENDIDFLNAKWTPMPLVFCINGNGKTIKNIKIEGDYEYAGLFVRKNAVNTGIGYVKDLTVDNITVTNTRADSATGTISGYSDYSIENCKVLNANVNGGKYAGGIAGQAYSTIKNCTVENAQIDGTYKVGGLTGQINNESGVIFVTGNTVKNASVTCTNVMSGKNAVIGKFIGYKNEAGGTITVNSNTAIEVAGADKDVAAP